MHPAPTYMSRIRTAAVSVFRIQVLHNKQVTSFSLSFSFKNEAHLCAQAGKRATLGRIICHNEEGKFSSLMRPGPTENLSLELSHVIAYS